MDLHNNTLLYHVVTHLLWYWCEYPCYRSESNDR